MTERPPLDLDALLAEADWLRPLARRLARTSDLDADDLLQDSVEVALTSAGPRDKSKLRPWLRRVMLNLHAMRQRGDTRRRMREEQVAADPGLGAAADPSRPDELVIRAEFRHAIASAMLRMREPYRRTLLWRYFEGWSVARIAKQEGVATATVRSRVQRGLALLRVDLDASWGEAWHSQCIAIAGGPSLWKLVPAAAILALAILPFALDGREPSVHSEQAASLDATGDSAPQTALSDQALAPAIKGSRKQSDRVENAASATVHALNTPPPPLPTERVLIRTVDDESGEPIAGAEIRTWDSNHYNRITMQVTPQGSRAEKAAVAQAAPILARTNQDGLAEINIPVYSQPSVHASTQEKSGTLNSLRTYRWGELVPAPDPREFEIRLQKLKHVSVYVIDHFGRPIEECDVALFAERPPNQRSQDLRQARQLNGLLMTAKSDSNGLAEFRIANFDSLQRRADRESFPLQLEACLFWPGELGEFVSVELDSVHAPPTLRAPRLGSLHVAVIPNEADSVAWLFPESGNEWTRDPHTVGVASEDGTFEFENLPLDKKFRLVMSQPEFARLEWSKRSWEVMGPTANDLDRVIQIDPSPGPWMSGRLLMRDDRPVPFRICRFDLLDTDLRRVGEVGSTFVEPDGRFTVHLGNRVPVDDKLARVAFLRVRPLLDQYSVERPFPSTPGEALVGIEPKNVKDGIDLGDIVLGSAPLLAGGRVLGANGDPIRGARVQLLEHWVEDPSGNGVNQSWTTTTDTHGSFRIAAVRLPLEGHFSYKINATTSDYRRNVTIECEYGMDDLEIHLPNTGGLQIGYRHLPRGWFVNAWLESTEDAENRFTSLNDLYWYGERGSHSQLTEHGIPEGRHTLHLELTAGMTEFQRESFGPFTIRADEVTAPPEIQDLDWMQLFRATRYELVDTSGQAVLPTSRPELFVGGAHTTGIVRTRGSIPMLLDGNIAYLPRDSAQEAKFEQGNLGTFSVNGYLPQKIDHPLDDQRIVLEAAPKIRLRVTGAPTLDPPQAWTLELKWLDAPEHYLVSSIRTKRWTSAAREIELPGWGRYQLDWFLTTTDGSATRHTEITRFYRDRPREIELAFPTELQAPN